MLQAELLTENINDIRLAVARFSGAAQQPVFVWAHGWGTNHSFFLPVAEALKDEGRHYLPDFPGFGQSDPPPAAWSVTDYADFIARWLKQQDLPPVIWVGHSFGCRVGLELAALYPDRVKGLALIAAPGLPRRRSLPEKLRLALKRRVAKVAGTLPLPAATRDKLKNAMGSADYRNAGPLRPTFVKVVNQNIAPLAPKIACPVLLIYGADDGETPPEIGMRLKALIPGADLKILPGYNHYTILSAGRFQLIHLLRQFIQP